MKIVLAGFDANTCKDSDIFDLPQEIGDFYRKLDEDDDIGKILIRIVDVEEGPK